MSQNTKTNIISTMPQMISPGNEGEIGKAIKECIAEGIVKRNCFLCFILCILKFSYFDKVKVILVLSFVSCSRLIYLLSAIFIMISKSPLYLERLLEVVGGKILFLV